MLAFMMSLADMHLIGVYHIGVHIMGVYLMGMHLTSVYLMGVHLVGVCLMGVYLTRRALHRCVPHGRVSRWRAPHWVSTS
jgi:hypothetical protein